MDKAVYLIDQIAEKIKSTAKLVNDIGVSYGKGGISLFLLSYYKVNQPNESGDAGYKILNDISKALHQDARKNFVHSAPLGILWHYLLETGLIDIDPISYFDEIDEFLIECVHDNSINGWRKQGALSILNYFYFRLNYLPDNNAKRASIKFAAISLFKLIDLKLSEAMTKDAFWGQQTSPSFYEYNFDEHNLLNYFTSTIKYIKSYPAFKQLSYPFQNHFKQLDEVLFEGNSIKPLSKLAVSIKSVLQCLYIMIQIDTLFADVKLEEKRQALYIFAKTMFVSDQIDKLAIYDLLICIRILKKIKAHAMFDFLQESITLSKKLQEVAIDRKNPASFNFSPGIPDLGLVNGLSGVGLILLDQANLIDGNWDDLIFTT